MLSGGVGRRISARCREARGGRRVDGEKVCRWRAGSRGRASCHGEREGRGPRAFRRAFTRSSVRSSKRNRRGRHGFSSLGLNASYLGQRPRSSMSPRTDLTLSMAMEDIYQTKSLILYFTERTDTIPTRLSENISRLLVQMEITSLGHIDSNNFLFMRRWYKIYE